MENEAAIALTDIVLSAGTLVLGLTVGPRKSFRTWTVLFITLALAAALGALFHGTIVFHSPEFWTMVSCTSVASAFLFFACCVCTALPQRPWLHWFWPIWGLMGLLVGGMLSALPFFYISIISGICVLLGALVLQKAPSKSARNWIYLGIVTTISGFLIREITHMDGLLGPNALFHLMQLTSNVFFWMGARRS